MSNRKNSIFVGGFVIAALLITIVASLFFAGGGLGSDRSKVVMAFDGSLRGLTIGAPVALRGVTIGQVTGINLILDADRGDVTMEVTAEIDPDSIQLVGGTSSRDKLTTAALVKRGLSAQLNTQSLLTGLLYIQLDFLPEKEPKMTKLDSPYPQIPTVPTELEEFRRSLETIDFATITENVDRIADGLDRLLNSEDMQALPATMRSSLAAVEDASKSLTHTLDQNSPALAELLDKGSNTFTTLNDQLPVITASLNSSLQRLDDMLTNANVTLEQVERAAMPDSGPRQQLSEAMQDLSLSARALRSLARSLEEYPESLIRGRQGDAP